MKKHVLVHYRKNCKGYRSIFILENLDNLEDLNGPGYKSYADDFYEDPDLMEQCGVIAACDLLYTSRDGKEIYFPTSTYMRSEFRGQKLGILLYKTALEVIAVNIQAKLHQTKPFIAYHEVGNPDIGATTIAAKRLYQALEKRDYLKKTPIPGLFRITKFPIIQHQRFTDVLT